MRSWDSRPIPNAQSLQLEKGVVGSLVSHTDLLMRSVKTTHTHTHTHILELVGSLMASPLGRGIYSLLSAAACLSCTEDLKPAPIICTYFKFTIKQITDGVFQNNRILAVQYGCDYFFEPTLYPPEFTLLCLEVELKSFEDHRVTELVFPNRLIRFQLGSDL